MAHTMMSSEELELLDIWNEEFGGFQIECSEMVTLLEDEGGNFKEENTNENEASQDKNLKAKRGRPRMQPLQPFALSLRRNVRHKRIF